VEAKEDEEQFMNTSKLTERNR